jgi:hypothetical protein
MAGDGATEEYDKTTQPAATTDGFALVERRRSLWVRGVWGGCGPQE